MELNRTAKEQVQDIRKHEELAIYIGRCDYLSAEDKEVLCSAIAEERLLYIGNLKVTIEAILRRRRAA